MRALVSCLPCVLLALTHPATAQSLVTPTLVKDINPGAANSSPRWFAQMGNRLFFAATDATNGNELWSTDGTAQGTVLVKDIWPGASSGQPTGLVALGNKFLFSAAQRLVNGRFPEFELWVSDGIANGTVQLKDLNGTASGGPGSMTLYKNAVYFLAADNGLGFWKTDGTANGTVKVAATTAAGMAEAGGTLWLAFYQSGMGTQLWKSDGSAPQLVTTLAKAFGYPGNFIKASLNVVFTATHDTAGEELWVTDGTANGTTVVDVDPGTGITLDSNPPAPHKCHGPHVLRGG